MAVLARGHWAVENRLYWQLDVSFYEEQRRVRTGHRAENFSRPCRISLNLLKQDATVELGIKTKRLNAGWDDGDLLKFVDG